jgi:hypothetical protein
MADESTPSEWPWPESLDAVEAAPSSHHVLLENRRVRVVEVDVQPGRREPIHTPRWPSVMLVDRAARIRYYDEDGDLAFESPERSADAVPFHAVRVELKD